MAKYRYEVRNVVYETYIIDVPDDVVELHEDTGEALEEYFYNLDDQEQFLVASDCFSWEVDEVTKVEN